MYSVTFVTFIAYKKVVINQWLRGNCLKLCYSETCFCFFIKKRNDIRGLGGLVKQLFYLFLFHSGPYELFNMDLTFDYGQRGWVAEKKMTAFVGARRLLQIKFMKTCVELSIVD